MTFDTIIRAESTEIALADGVIAAIEPAGALGEDAREVIDARGLAILPGLIDAHVHFNDPGRAAWEGWGSGTRALAAGGFTCAVDMPLNSDPPTLDAARSRPSWLPRRAPRTSTSHSGAGSCPATSSAWTSSLPAASSASRRSWPTAAWTTSPPATTSRCTRACAARQRSACPSPCTPSTP